MLEYKAKTLHGPFWSKIKKKNIYLFFFPKEGEKDV